jgi:cobalt-zinc-cadmium efflux system protein
MGHVHHANPGARYRRRLAIVFILAAGYMVAEFAGGLLSGSLALLADAGHMLADVGGIGLSLMAIWISSRPATMAKSYGYYRAEILAALLNGAILFGISGFILYEAIVRLQSPPEINSGLMMVVAAGGVVINLTGAFLLHSGASESLDIEAAFLEVISDLIGSIGVIVAGGIILFTGWWYADPLFSILIALLIVPRTYRLVRRAVHVLLEGTPEGINVDELEAAICAVPCVTAVHDLHVWLIGSGIPALSVHVDVEPEADDCAILDEVQDLLAEHFEIHHSTIQIERQPRKEAFFHHRSDNQPTVGH